MTYILKKTFFALLIIIITANALVANPLTSNTDYFNPLDLGFEFSLSNGYTTNLLEDSTDVEDSYTTSSLRLKMYPASSLEVILFADYSYYSKTYNISSLSKGVSFTYIPTKKNSLFSAFLAGSFSGRTYQEALSSFDNNNFSLIGSYGFKIGPAASLRAGMLFESTSYLFSDAPDNETYKLFHGINFTVFGSNSIDIEAGYSTMNISYILDTTYNLFQNSSGNYDDYHTAAKLNSFYFSPRFSRPLGSKTGFNFTFHHRKFLSGENGVILGSAVNLISPWGNIYEGQAYTISLKTKIIPKTIISFGAGYWKKAYLRTMIIAGLYPPRDAEVRYDEQNRFFLIVERPIFFKSGSILKPKLQIDIKNNNTTTFTMFDLYDYSNFSINFTLSYEI